MKGWAAKREFREQWAKRKFAGYAAGRSYNRSFESSEETEGEFLTFGAIVQKLGGFKWSAAVAGAQRLCSRCAALGGKWIRKDEFTGMYMFYFVSHKHKETFARKWAEFENYMDKQDGADSAELELQSGESTARLGVEMAAPAPGPKDPLTTPPKPSRAMAVAVPVTSGDGLEPATPSSATPSASPQEGQVDEKVTKPQKAKKTKEDNPADIKEKGLWKEALLFSVTIIGTPSPPPAPLGRKSAYSNKLPLSGRRAGGGRTLRSVGRRGAEAR